MDWLTLERRTNQAALKAFGYPVLLDGALVAADFTRASGAAMLDGVDAWVNRPQLVVVEHDVPAQPVGKLVQIGHPYFEQPVQYVVADARPDGRGMTVLLLEVPI